MFVVARLAGHRRDLVVGDVGGVDDEQVDPSAQVVGERGVEVSGEDPLGRQVASGARDRGRVGVGGVHLGIGPPRGQGGTERAATRSRGRPRRARRDARRPRRGARYAAAGRRRQGRRRRAARRTMPTRRRARAARRPSGGPSTPSARPATTPRRAAGGPPPRRTRIPPSAAPRRAGARSHDPPAQHDGGRLAEHRQVLARVAGVDHEVGRRSLVERRRSSRARPGPASSPRRGRSRPACRRPRARPPRRRCRRAAGRRRRRCRRRSRRPPRRPP